MITSFSHIYYRVPDVEKAFDWYSNVLGFKVLRKYSMGGRVSGYCTLAGVLLELTQLAEGTVYPPGHRVLGLTVDNMDATLADLQAKGVELVDPPFDARTFWGRQAVIKDPFGYLVSLREWAAPDGPEYPDWQPKHEGVTRLV